mmetsp:Transcript_32839/g.60095  ORF Transcript_32839/g.60095 Transcript_32839/m.60095 type:complete len:226 (-) Transcript_32839:484-1161(-)
MVVSFFLLLPQEEEEDVRFAELKVFLRSMAIVIGPTPPGTGVILLATALAGSKATSPTSRYPAFLDASSTELIPTSMTTHPGFSQSAGTNSARPMAAITMSASRTAAAWSAVRLCTIVTVASRRMSSMATGRPTMLERPSTTAFLPAISTPLRSSSSMHPWGVQATWKSRSSNIQLMRVPAWVLPMSSLAALSGCRPSTSFSGAMAFSTVFSSMCSGMGSCTRIP